MLLEERGFKIPSVYAIIWITYTLSDIMSHYEYCLFRYTTSCELLRNTSPLTIDTTKFSVRAHVIRRLASAPSLRPLNSPRPHPLTNTASTKRTRSCHSTISGLRNPLPNRPRKSLRLQLLGPSNT